MKMEGAKTPFKVGIQMLPNKDQTKSLPIGHPILKFHRTLLSYWRLTAMSSKVFTMNICRKTIIKRTINGEKSIPIGGKGRRRLTIAKTGSVTL
jgi:hypothetical protein